MITDSHGRIINYLRLAVTDRCNLRCAYCQPASGLQLLPNEELLSLNEILRVADAAASLGIYKIRLTGG